jgi:Na+-translocating ferredoxin:NAD+ oxidoreductase RnfD subunit
VVDPRVFQIAALSALLAVGIGHFELGASASQAVLTIGAAVATQALACRVLGKTYDWKSPAITGLSLTLLLRTHDPLVWAASGVIGITAKFLFRVRGKHLFNPACLAIVILLLATNEVWVSPGQWGTLGWEAAALAAAAGLVLSRAGRIDMAVAFLSCWWLLLAARCLWLGDPWSIPVHQMQSGALLIFACFMITDPRSTPNSRAGRLVFAATVALVGHWLQFYGQIREGLFYALVGVSLVTPLLDMALPQRRFTWVVQEV